MSSYIKHEDQTIVVASRNEATGKLCSPSIMLVTIATFGCLNITGVAPTNTVQQIIQSTNHSSSYVCSYGPATYADQTPIPVDNFKYFRSTAEDINRIREVINPAVSDLARVFNVSRRSVYDWIKGSNPNDEHFEKIQDLAKAADIFAKSNVQVTHTLLKRKLYKNQSFFDAFANGESAVEAATFLTNIANKENAHSKRISERFAGRTQLKTVSAPELDFA
jgi:DNA-binding transcriptional regulator YiaG